MREVKIANFIISPKIYYNRLLSIKMDYND